jgi:hypothetical protein
MPLLSTLALAMGASWASGLRLYAAVGVLGALGRWGGLALPGHLAALTNGWVIGVAGALYAVEFFADKVPLVDSAWDAVHTFIRIPAGAVLAAAAFGDFSPVVQVLALLAGGGLALSAHGTKAAARVAVNMSPEPFSNVAVSTTEDGLALGSLLLAAFVPVLLILLVVLAVAASLLMLPRIVRLLRRRRGAQEQEVG